MKSFPKYFIPLIMLLVLILFIHRYYEYVVNKNFVIEVNTACDPFSNKCFDASPDLSFGQNPYKKISITAKYAPKCLEEHNCVDFTCEAVPKGAICEITYCSDEVKVEGENCTNENQ